MNEEVYLEPLYTQHKIIKVIQDDYKLLLCFENGIEISIFDARHICCEDRFMTCDDDVNSLIGSKLRSIELSRVSYQDDDVRYNSAHDVDPNNSVHDACFLNVNTDQGSIQLVMHNAHNGYYAGFDPAIRQRRVRKS